jgi:hypothetical protein
MLGLQPVEVRAARQDQPGLGSVHDMDQQVPPVRFIAGGRGPDGVGDLGRMAAIAVAVAHRHVDHADRRVA